MKKTKKNLMQKSTKGFLCKKIGTESHTRDFGESFGNRHI
jgi:hypothetical protein